MNAKTDGKIMSKSEVELRMSMRKLWESRAVLLRDYIVKEIEGSKDAKEAKNRLLENAGDLGSSIKPYYGSLAKIFLTGYLKKDVKFTEQVIKATKKVNKKALALPEKDNKEALALTDKVKGTALNLVDMAKEKALDLLKKAKEIALDLLRKARGKALALTDKAKEEALEPTETAKEEALELTDEAKEEALDRAKKKWYKNARNLAGFFAISRNQTKEYLTGILYKHLDLTWSEIESILNKEEATDLEYYEQDKAHMLMFSDVLVAGLVKDYPEKFEE